MGELEKILFIINRWGYLNTKQIGLLVNKKKRATEELLKTLHKKGLLKVDKHTHRNIYLLSCKGNTFVGRDHKKALKSITMNYSTKTCWLNDLSHKMT